MGSWPKKQALWRDSEYESPYHRVYSDLPLKKEKREVRKNETKTKDERGKGENECCHIVRVFEGTSCAGLYCDWSTNPASLPSINIPTPGHLGVSSPGSAHGCKHFIRCISLVHGITLTDPIYDSGTSLKSASSTIAALQTLLLSVQSLHAHPTIS